jgi:hypothetical protein
MGEASTMDFMNACHFHLSLTGTLLHGLLHYRLVLLVHGLN